MVKVNEGTLHEVFRYHEPNADQARIYVDIRSAGSVFAQILLTYCPDSRERSLALTKIQEAVMWANASVALEAVKD